MVSALRTSSRRGLLAASALGVMLVTGCGGGGGRSRQDLSTLPPALSMHDAAILNAALDSEHQLIAAYTAGIPLLGEPGKLAAEQFLGQHLAHAGELAGWVKQAHAKPNKPPAAYALGQPRTATEMLTMLHSLESAMITAYLEAIPKLSPGKLRANTASIVANEAQHVAVLGSVLGRAPAPLALVTGAG